MGNQLTERLSHIVVVLVEPERAINVGTVMRAMKNMGLIRLRLVKPAEMDLSMTQIAAHRTQDVLDAMETFSDLDSALKDCHLAIGLTARSRTRDWKVSAPQERAKGLIEMAAVDEQVALVFGRERTGLTNEELERCDEFMTLSTNPDYTSLNLAQAVLLTCYELASAAGAPIPEPQEERPLAPIGDRARLLSQIRYTLECIGFFKSDTASGVMHTFSRVLSRARLDAQEARLLTGVFVEVLKFAHLVRRGILPPELPRATVEAIDATLLEEGE